VAVGEHIIPVDLLHGLSIAQVRLDAFPAKMGRVLPCRVDAVGSLLAEDGHRI